MDKSPGELDDDQLVERLKKDVQEVSPAKSVEDNAPVDLDRAPAEGHSQEPM